MNTTYFINCVAGNLFGSKTTPALPTDYYVGLSTTQPSADGSGITEPLASAGYARVKVTSFSTPSNGVVTNASSVEFPDSTASWGTITHFVIFDSGTRGSGNALMYGALDEPRTVEKASVMTFRTGGITLSVKSE